MITDVRRPNRLIIHWNPELVINSFKDQWIRPKTIGKGRLNRVRIPGYVPLIDSYPCKSKEAANKILDKRLRDKILKATYFNSELESVKLI